MGVPAWEPELGVVIPGVPVIEDTNVGHVAMYNCIPVDICIRSYMHMLGEQLMTSLIRT